MPLAKVPARVLCTALFLLCLALATTAAAQSCPVGSSSPTGEEPCTPCPSGSYAGAPGSTECQPCAAGSSAPTPGSAFCAPCAPGHVAPAPGQTFCQPCAAGTFQTTPGGIACTVCPEGSYAADPGSSQCTPCDCDDGDPETEDPCDATTGECLSPVAVEAGSWGVVKSGRRGSRR